MSLLHEQIAARMREEGWTPARVAAFARAQRELEEAHPRFKAPDATQHAAMTRVAGEILDIAPADVMPHSAAVYVYPESLLYVWSDTHVVVVNVTGGYLRVPRTTPYWSILTRYADGERG